MNNLLILRILRMLPLHPCQKAHLNLRWSWLTANLIIVVADALITHWKFLLRLKDFEGVVGAGVLKGEWRINVKRFNQIPPISSLCHWWPWWTKCYLCNSRPTSCDDEDDKQNPCRIDTFLKNGFSTATFNRISWQDVKLEFPPIFAANHKCQDKIQKYRKTEIWNTTGWHQL